ncbi:MAG TPA: DUF4062 domain-containing protein, partial [Thermomicrobiales bacterium]|nr:DUF4062 domain-containing protein [Thermomicrobiales bacterium]
EVSDFERRPDSSTFDACFEAIHYCDFYILLVGERYGSIFQDGISVTNQEFRVAKALADQKRIAMIPFVRKSIWQEAELAAAAGGESTIRAADAHAAEQMARVLAFVDELKSTKLLDDAGKEAGNLWIYTFDSFADIAGALRIALRANTDVTAQRAIANLRAEIESNIARIVSKQGNLPFPFYAPMQLPEVRAALQVGVDAQGTERRIDRTVARRLAIALMMAGEYQRLEDEGLEEAIRSGEFLRFDNQTRTFFETPELEVMRRLSGEIDRLRQMAELSKNPPFSELSDQILRQADSGDAEITVSADLLLLGSIILRAGENMLRLMAALHHWMATGELIPPQVDSASYETESLRRLQHEAAEARDVATWLGYPVIADLLTGDSTANGEDRAAAAIAFPALGGESYQAAVRQLADEAVRVFYQNSGETTDQPT